MNVPQPAFTLVTSTDCALCIDPPSLSPPLSSFSSRVKYIPLRGAGRHREVHAAGAGHAGRVRADRYPREGVCLRELSLAFAIQRHPSCSRRDQTRSSRSACAAPECHVQSIALYAYFSTYRSRGSCFGSFCPHPPRHARGLPKRFLARSFQCEG